MKNNLFYRNSAINSYVTAVINQWIKAFGEDFVITRKSVKTKLEKLISSYYSNVYNKGTLDTNVEFYVTLIMVTYGRKWVHFEYTFLGNDLSFFEK